MTTESLPYVAGSATSKAAADAMANHVVKARLRILDAIKAAGIHGLTRQQITEQTNICGDSVRPRCVELIEAGLITPSDEIRRTVTGRAAEVLVAV